jgi:hypothetical protein
MSNVYHDAIPYSGPLTSLLFNTALGALDQELVNQDARLDALELFPTGASGFTQLNLGAAAALTIASNTITVTRTRHIIDGEGGAADSLQTITGSNGDLLILQIANAARPITILHGTDNIFMSDETNRVLDDPAQQLWLIRDDASGYWGEHRFSGNVNLNNGMDASVLAGTLEVPAYGSPSTGRYRVSMLPSFVDKTHRAYIANNGAVFSDKFTAPTTVGTLSASNDNDGHWINFLTGSVSGNPAGLVSLFTYTRRAHDCYVDTVVKMVDITDVLHFIGLFSTTPAVADDPSASGIGFRFSSATDAGWVGLVSSGAGNVSTTAAIATVSANGIYKLRAWIDDSAAKAYFSINDSVPVTLTTNLPGASTELGYVNRQMTTAAGGKNHKWARGSLYGN